MILFINTLKNDLIQIKLIDKGKVLRQKESHEQFKQAELLLPMISEVVKKNKLEAIAVVSGPGAFSALRFGLTTANTLAWSLNLPVIELTADEVKDDLYLIKLLEDKFIKMKTGEFEPVLPQYGKEPHIT